VNKQRLLLFGVLISVVALVVLNIGMAGNGHVEVVNENVTLEEKNTTLTKQNQTLTQENKQLNEQVEVLETAVETYEKADSARSARDKQSWELAVPIGDTITKYNEKVVYIETDKDSLSIEYTSLQDSLWKWALGPTLMYTTYPDTNVVYLMDLSRYYMITDDFGTTFNKMTDVEYKRYQTFIQIYGLSAEALWKFRSDMRIQKLAESDLEDRKVWKYRRKYK
jgi:cell division protein FtsB